MDEAKSVPQRKCPSHEQRTRDGENCKKLTDTIGGQRNEGRPTTMECHTVTDRLDGSLGEERVE